MATDIKSKRARGKLTPRREPYWHCVRIGLYVGYRRLEEGAGTWIARRRADDGKGQQYRALGTLEEFEEDERLDEAVKLANTWGAGVDGGATHKAVTVEDACRAYVTHQTGHKSKASAADAEGRFRRLVYGTTMGKTHLDKLHTDRVEAWMRDQLDEDGDEEDLRRSKDSANRNLATFKAALNRALKSRLVSNDSGWRTVEAYPGVGRRRGVFLDANARAALLEHCPADLRALVTALALTGARPGEIARADVGHLDIEQGTIILSGKTGRRTATLSTAAVEYLRTQAQGKTPGAPLLSDAYGKRWDRHKWKDPLKAAVVAAGLPDGVVLYSIRHAAVTEMIAGGLDAVMVAKLAGTSVEMIRRHYLHSIHAQERAMLDRVQMIAGNKPAPTTPPPLTLVKSA